MNTKEHASFEGMNLLISRPAGYDPSERYAAMLFLHGAGTRGDDLTALHNNPFFRFLDARDEKLLVWAPQCAEGRTWFDYFERLERLLAHIASQPDVDPDRVVLSGVSMGGYGSWQLGMSCPQYLAGLAPLCGGGMAWTTGALKHVPVWAFHGALDTAVQPEESLRMVRGVNANGGSARLTIYPDAAHNCWDPTFGGDEYWNWVTTRKREQN